MSIDLTTSYGGLKLRNPIVIGASNIVTDIENLLKLEQAGAAAVVYKSLFEEQIQLESYQLDQVQETYSNWDAEHESFFPSARHAGPAEHLRQLREAKSKLSIPVIGSLNCINNETWIEYALRMLETGIDGLELNFYNNNIDPGISAAEIEEIQFRTVELIRKSAPKTPLFIKLSPFYSNTLKLVDSMDKIGANGFVLFNRLFQPDIDIDLIEHHYPYNFSSESDNRLALRYAGLLHKKIKGSIIANTGIFTGKDTIKMLLAGADAVQVVSAIYKRGINHVETMIEEMTAWMKKKNFTSLNDFKGKLSRINLPDPFAYRRAQYVDILMKSEIFLQYHPKRGEISGNSEFDI